MEFHYKCALYKCASYLEKHITVYSPIVHNHPIAVEVTSIPRNWEFWKNHRLDMLCGADALHVYRLAGWETSTGVQAEIAFAKSIGIPIIYID